MQEQPQGAGADRAPSGRAGTSAKARDRMQELQVLAEADAAAAFAPRTAHPGGTAHPGARDVLGVFWKGRWAVLCCALAGIGLAWAYAAASPRQYQASAEVLIDGRAGPVTASQGAPAAPLEIAEVESQVELIRSAQIIDEALDRLPAAQVDAAAAMPPSVVQRLRAAVGGLFARQAPAAAPEADPRRGRVDAVRDRLSVRRVGASYAVEVGFTASTPDAAAAVADAVAAAYVRHQVKNKSDLWRRASAWMQQRLEDLGAQASSSARTAQEFKSAHGIIDTGRGLVNEQQLQDSNTALLDARAKAVEADSRYDEARKAASAGADRPIPGSETDSVVGKLRADAAGLREQLADLKARYGDSHEAVVQTEAQLRALEMSLFAESERLVAALGSERDVAHARVAGLEAALRDNIARSSQTSQDRVRANELDRTAETYNSLYAGLLHRYTDAVDQESFPLAMSEVISAAAVPTAPSAPRTALLMLLGAVAGAGLGTALAFTLDAVDGSLSGAADVEALGVPCYGLLPRLERGRAFEHHRRALSHSTALPADASADRLRLEFLRHAPASPFARSLQSVKTHLVLAGADLGNRVIGITSTRAGEGKSTVAGNLAHLFTRSDGRTLLIDADLYDPTVSRLLQLDGRPGLAEILDGTARFADVAETVEDGSFTVLSAGRADGARVDFMLGSDRMRRLLDELRPLFDRIIVDLPPVGEIASTRELAPSLDGVVIVATWGGTRASALRATLRGLSRDRTNVLGVVLNRSDGRSASSPAGYPGYGRRLRARLSA